LVMSKEDETADGEWRARQNVVHEAGLFQGRYGFGRAIAIVEDGCTVFSNIAGIQQLRYRHDIREVFGEAVATIRREFPGS
jgi:predicted nucleotide-binding protein